MMDPFIDHGKNEFFTIGDPHFSDPNELFLGEQFLGESASTFTTENFSNVNDNLFSTTYSHENENGFIHSTVNEFQTPNVVVDYSSPAFTNEFSNTNGLSHTNYDFLQNTVYSGNDQTQIPALTPENSSHFQVHMNSNVQKEISTTDMFSHSNEHPMKETNIHHDNLMIHNAFHQNLAVESTDHIPPFSMPIPLIEENAIRPNENSFNPGFNQDFSSNIHFSNENIANITNLNSMNNMNNLNSMNNMNNLNSMNNINNMNSISNISRSETLIPSNILNQSISVTEANDYISYNNEMKESEQQFLTFSEYHPTEGFKDKKQNDRNWTLIRYPQHDIDPNLNVEINISIRGEDASCFVPDRLYCSHRYKFEHNIISSTLQTRTPLLLSRMLVVDPETQVEIRSRKVAKKSRKKAGDDSKYDKINKEIIKGNAEAACIANEQGFKCKNRIQFTESCYKHNRQDFQILIHYCEPQSKEDPLFSIKSPPLKIFSRKPSVPVSTLTNQYKPTKKRKKNSNDEKRKKSRLSYEGSIENSEPSENNSIQDSKSRDFEESIDTIEDNGENSLFTEEESQQSSDLRLNKKEISRHSFIQEDTHNSNQRTELHPKVLKDLFSKKLESLLSKQKNLDENEKSRAQQHMKLQIQKLHSDLLNN